MHHCASNVAVVVDIFRCYQAIKARHRTIIGSLVSIDRSLVVGRSIHGQLTSHNFSRGSHDPRVVGQNIHSVPSRPERSIRPMAKPLTLIRATHSCVPFLPRASDVRHQSLTPRIWRRIMLDAMHKYAQKWDAVVSFQMTDY